MRKVITKSIFHFYNYLNNRVISKLQNECEYVNKTLHNRDEEKKNCLNRFGIDKKFEDLPVIKKKAIINLSKKIDKSEIKSWAFTGGSFGEPLRVPYSKYRNSVRTATFKYFNERAGYKTGDSFALIRAKNKPKLIKYLRNETIIIPNDVSEKNIGAIISLIIKNKVTILMGYPTVMFDIAKYIESKKLKLPVIHLISTSEMLDQDKRIFIQKIFDCNFIDRYSNEEVGLIAQQEVFGGDYFVNRFGVYVEVLGKNDKPVESGEIGRVVVSDFNNDLIPFLRYDTGDIAIAGEYKNGQLLTLKQIIGRTADIIYNTSGKPVSSLALGPAIYKPLSNASLNTQFQFIQTNTNNYILKLKSKENQIKSEVIYKINILLKEILGDNANILIKFVDDILPLNSGKRPVYINEYKRFN
ncbi:hypothetical protein [Psychroflexus sp. ALD_RP9]|uniref:hypothetical protein n=1 Tax=Psychroflexus sp. ALD_RP9 TaxID=2777186 RepID=UPI001A8EA5E2|nr:hypothetical protein [Psychroflexus sp. ALD_RP9]QSS98021.1 hypothetical protein IMZ30_04720 [Psychroflexus sp. ALD_RP9]